jgi:hypothetical protein
MRDALTVDLTEDQARALRQWARRREAGSDRRRDRDQQTKKAARCRKRFLKPGMAGLEKDAPRPGCTPTITAGNVQEVVRKTTQENPSNATHWSTRTMAEAAGLSENACADFGTNMV